MINWLDKYGLYNNIDLIDRMVKNQKGNDNLSDEVIILAKKEVSGRDKIFYHARSYNHNEWLIRDVAVSQKRLTMTTNEMLLYFNRLIDLEYKIFIIE